MFPAKSHSKSRFSNGPLDRGHRYVHIVISDVGEDETTIIGVMFPD